MKLLKYVLLGLLISASAFSKGFICVEDARPRDGDLHEVKLVPMKGGLYEVLHTWKAGGECENGPCQGGADNEVIATGLTCILGKKNPVLANCMTKDKWSTDVDYYTFDSRVEVSYGQEINHEGKEVTTPKVRLVNLQSFANETKQPSSFTMKFTVKNCRAL